MSGHAELSPNLSTNMSASARHRETTALVGMTIFIASWVMLFASLFFAYALTRLRASAWPPLDLPALPTDLPTAATVALGIATVALLRARSAHSGRRTRLLAVALLAELAFLVLQLIVWRECWRAGLRPESGTYASVFYGLTVFHALHVLVGIVALGVLTVRQVRGRLSPLALRLWSLYLHLVAALWVCLFVAVYLL